MRIIPKVLLRISVRYIQLSEIRSARVHRYSHHVNIQAKKHHHHHRVMAMSERRLHREYNLIKSASSINHGSRSQGNVIFQDEVYKI